MGHKFSGTLDELKQIFSKVKGEWSKTNEKKYQFKAENGGIVNWWQETMTMLFQGKSEGKTTLENIFSTHTGSEQRANNIQRRNNKKIFIVHGHDNEAKDQLDLALRRLGLEPFILMNSTGGGKTIIEALEGHIGRDFSSDFGIVLLTPDDKGFAVKDGQDKMEPRARQNVILEAGMLLASLTRERIAFIVKGHIELPSDLQGVIHLGYNEHIKEIIPKLCKRLQEVGFNVDSSKISEAVA